MKRAFLDEGRPEEVAHAIRQVVEARGALVREHVARRVRFADQPKGRAWLRDGYVGIYQPLGEPQVEVRLLLRARWPWRILWTVALLNLVLALVLVITAPDGNTWFLAAFAGGFALLAAALVHLNTLEPVRQEEAAWMEAFEQELRRELPETELEDALQHERRAAELELEGEIAQRRVARARKSAPKPPKEKGRRFSLRPNKEKEPEESPEDRLAKLRARKAELEAQQQREADGKA